MKTFALFFVALVVVPALLSQVINIPLMLLGVSLGWRLVGCLLVGALWGALGAGRIINLADDL